MTTKAKHTISAPPAGVTRIYVGIDPATSTGYATPLGSGTWSLQACTESKKLKRAAEPKYCRPGKLFQRLDELQHEILESLPPLVVPDIVLVCEGAASFQRGKAAVRVSHELRGAVQTWCWVRGHTYVEIEPADLKKFATGKGNATKDDMLAVARKHYKEDCETDDEADALHLLAWAKTNYRL